MSVGELTLQQRYPEVFRQSPLKRFGPLVLVIGVVAYIFYAVWFFNLPQILSTAHWERMGIYLSQWISYDIQPNFRLDQEKIAPQYPRLSALGNDPHPDWVKTDPAADKWEVDVDAAHSVTFTKATATIVNGADTVELLLTSGKPIVQGDPPAWLRVYPDEVVADFGFAGEIRVAADRVKVRKRFLGWPNFIFDTNSPFFGKSAGEVAGLVVAGPDLKKGMPNWRLALDNFWTNNQWQHGDIIIKLLQTLVMAFLGTLLGALVAFPLAFLAARNITRNGALNWGLKRFFDFMRSVDMLIWALFFTRAFGPGPLAGSAAIFFTETGTLGKIYSEGLENIDDKPREGVTSTGANEVLVQRYGVIPQVIPVMISQTLYQWESNTRGATIIGAVGAGGIGLKLWEAMRTNSNWANVFYMVLLILLVVFIFDSISNALRSRLIGRQN
jgi:phosphonate transport system permease protein